MDAKANASDAAMFNDLYTFGSSRDCDFARAVWRSGCTFVPSGSLTVDAPGEMLLVWRCFGDDEMVVTVVAVRGRSWIAPATAAPDESGSFPVSSNFRIRCLRSSTSSQIVEGAVVDTVDAVSSATCICCFFPRGLLPDDPTNVEDLCWPALGYDKLDCRYALVGCPGDGSRRCLRCPGSAAACDQLNVDVSSLSSEPGT